MSWAKPWVTPRTVDEAVGRTLAGFRYRILLRLPYHSMPRTRYLIDNGHHFVCPDEPYPFQFTTPFTDKHDHFLIDFLISMKV